MTDAAHSTAAPATEEDVTTTLYRAAIGPVNTGYYLPIFGRFEAADHAGISWNHSAGLLTLNWLLFRRLWLAALGYAAIMLALALLVFGIGRLVLDFSDTLMMVLGLGFGLVAFVLPGLFGNALLHSECRKRMSKALAAHANVADACTQLLQKASTRRRMIWLAVVNAAVALVTVVVYLQFSLTVMPQAAVESGHVVVGQAVDMAAASAPEMVTASAPASTVSAAASGAANAQASVASASASAVSAVSTAVAPVSVTSAALAASAPVHAPSAPQSVPSTPSRPPALVASAPLAAASAMATTAKSEAQIKESHKPVELPPKRVAKERVKKDPPAPKEEHASAPSQKPYFINVGLFANPDNADNAHAKLLEAHLPSVTKELKSSKVPRLIRVRVGPFSGLDEANAAAVKIKALQLDAVVIQP